MEAANRLATYRKTAFNEIQHDLFVRALDEYKKSQEYVADFPMGRHNLGNYYSKLHDQGKAVENYREALAIDNLFYPAEINLAIIYYQEGNMDSAVVLFRDIIVKHPGVVEGYYYLALLYGEQKRYTEAISLLETATTKPEANPRIFYNLGLMYQKTGQNDKCEAALLKGLGLDPCNFDLLYALYAFHMNLDDRAKAAPYVEKLKTCFPDEKQVQDMYKDFASKK
jgi:tetratricopeptide (TPR) repeat protein